MTVTLTARSGGTLVEPPSGSSSQLPFTYTWTYTYDGNEVEIPGKFTTSHTVYRVVGPPKSPWNVSGDATLRPWVAALDYAVQWAEAWAADPTTPNAVTTHEEAATAITITINAGAGRVLRYDSGAHPTAPAGQRNYGQVHGLAGGTRLHNFMLYLRDGTNVATARHTTGNAPQLVNCSDCGSLVSAFGSILGSQLRLVQINAQNHKLNPIREIGTAAGFGSPCTNDSMLFSHHALAALDALGTNPKRYDACLKVRHPDPTKAASGTAVLPTGMTLIINDPVSITTTFTQEAGSTANGTISFAPHRHNTIVDSVYVRCNVIINYGGGTTVTSLMGVITITSGAQPFHAGDEFTVTTNYDYNEYRSPLAAPDFWHYGPTPTSWSAGQVNLAGRSVTGTVNVQLSIVVE